MDRTDTQMAKSEDAKPAAGAVSHPSAARAPRQCSPARTCPAIQPSRAMAMPQSERHRQTVRNFGKSRGFRDTVLRKIAF